MTATGPVPRTNPVDPAADPRAFWAAVAGVAPEQLVFPPPPSPVRQRCARWLDAHPRIRAPLARLLRLWRIIWFGPHHPDPAPLPATPLNLAPWTHQLLSAPHDTTDTRGFQLLRDRVLWVLSHPGTRYETHAWRTHARAKASLSWHLHTLRRTLAGRPPGPPPGLQNHLAQRNRTNDPNEALR